MHGWKGILGNKVWYIVKVDPLVLYDKVRYDVVLIIILFHLERKVGVVKRSEEYLVCKEKMWYFTFFDGWFCPCLGKGLVAMRLNSRGPKVKDLLVRRLKNCGRNSYFQKNVRRSGKGMVWDWCSLSIIFLQTIVGGLKKKRGPEERARQEEWCMGLKFAK